MSPVPVEMLANGPSEFGSTSFVAFGLEGDEIVTMYEHENCVEMDMMAIDIMKDEWWEPSVMSEQASLVLGR